MVCYEARVTLSDANHGEALAAQMRVAPEGLLAAALAATAAPGDYPASVQRETPRLLELGPEQLLLWLDRALLSSEVDVVLGHLRASGALRILLPEVAALVDFHETSTRGHKDLWSHTLEVTRNTPPDVDLRWAALFHDVGKVPTRISEQRGKLTFWRHEPVGAWLFRGAAARFGMPASRCERIAFVIVHTARVNAYEVGWSDRAVRRLVRDAGERLGDLLAFSGADYTTARPNKRASIRRRLAHLEARIERLRAEDAAPGLPSGLGAAVREGLSLEPGPAIGEAIAWLRGEVAAGRLPADAPFEVYVHALQQRSPHPTPVRLASDRLASDRLASDRLASEGIEEAEVDVGA